LLGVPKKNIRHREEVNVAGWGTHFFADRIPRAGMQETVFSRKLTPLGGEKDRHEHHLVRPTGLDQSDSPPKTTLKPESRKAREPEMQGDTGAPMPIRDLPMREQLTDTRGGAGSEARIWDYRHPPVPPLIPKPRFPGKMQAS
jgi:hypothetical protein